MEKEKQIKNENEKKGTERKSLLQKQNKLQAQLLSITIDTKSDSIRTYNNNKYNNIVKLEFYANFYETLKANSSRKSTSTSTTYKKKSSRKSSKVY